MHAFGPLCRSLPGISRAEPVAGCRRVSRRACLYADRSRRAGAGRADPQPKEQAEQKPAAEQVDAAEESPVYTEQVVVTASKNEEALVNAPAAVSLITSQTIMNTASTSYADLLRSVPGRERHADVGAGHQHHVARRDQHAVDVAAGAASTAAASTSTSSASSPWDFLPVNPAEIKQIEVIRGPASAIWGANAMTGVVNVITKSPRELQGTSATIGFGGFNRESSDARARHGSLFYVAARTRRRSTTAGPTRCRRAYYTQDPCCVRPAICRTVRDHLSGLRQHGHEQPKFDLARRLGLRGRRAPGVPGRLSRAPTGSSTAASGRSTSTRGTVLGYGKVNFSKARLQGQLLPERPDGNATNLLAFGSDGPAARVRLQDPDLRFRARRTSQSVGSTQHPHLRRQLPARTSSI